MNIKKQIPKFMSILLGFSMTFNSILSVNAAEVIILESVLEETERNETNEEEPVILADGRETQLDDGSIYEEIEVHYNQASSYFVTIPKVITLDTDKRALYSVEVSGDIAAEQCVYVAPVDGISSTESIDFYMEDQSPENKKADVVATVTQNKLHWNSEEAANGYEEADNLVNAPDLTAGDWKGIFHMEIKLETHSTHTHSYTEKITKEPTCTETGEKTYTCDCGDSYTEEISATGHHFEDGTCIDCGEKDPDAFEKIKIGDTETRVIAGQTLEFICIDEAYVDATGKEVGALFIAKDFISGSELSMGTDHQSDFVKDWASNTARTELNGSNSDLTDLLAVNTTITKAYSNIKSGGTTINYDMQTIDLYGTASDYDASETLDRVFILSLEEAIKYNKVNIGGKEISVMWDLNCDGTVEFKSGSKGRYGYFLRTPIASKYNNSAYEIDYRGSVMTANTNLYGIRPCYVKYNGFNHIHSYTEEITKEPTCTETGEKTYICDCGDSYTEEIPATGHHFEDGTCIDCGEKDSDIHVHNYVEKITKEPTCTETGEKTYICDCGDSYTEEIPAKGHSYTEEITKEPTCTEIGEKTFTCLDCGDSYMEEIPATKHRYENGECIDCGNTDAYYMAPDDEYLDWNYTLDDENDIITLNYYDNHYLSASNLDVIVYANYMIDGKTYKAQLASNADDATSKTPYMFNDYAKVDPGISIKSIIFSDSIDTSNVTNMSYMFGNCTSLTSLDLGCFDTHNVTSMYCMFSNCTNLKIIYATQNKWSTDKANVGKMFYNCGTSKVTYK